MLCTRVYCIFMLHLYSKRLDEQSAEIDAIIKRYVEDSVSLQSTRKMVMQHYQYFEASNINSD